MPALTKSDVQTLRKELEIALRAVSNKLGIDFKVGTIRYDAVSARCKIEGTQRGAAGLPANIPVDPDLVNLKRFAFLLPAGFDYTKTYKTPTLGTVQVIGYRSRSHKYPFIVRCLRNGRKFKLSLNQTFDAVSAGEI